jgi:hypothetical protein
MRKYLLAVACIIFGLVAYASDSYMYVKTTSGEKGIALADVASVQFPSQGGLTVIHAGGNQTVFDASDFEYVRFAEDSSSVNELTKVVPSLTFDGESLFADGKITVYSLTGAVIASSESGSLSVKDLEQGVYVAKAGSATLKFLKK